MHRRLILSSVALLALASLAACTLGTPTLTPVAPPTAIPTAPPAPTPLPTATAIPPATPTPAPKAPLSLAQIKAAVARIYAQSNAHPDDVLQQYSASLHGSAIQGWDGWVEVTYQTNGTWGTTLALDDPYAPDVPPTMNPTPVAGPPLTGTADAALSGLSAPTAAALSVGQHLRFSGTLDSVRVSFGFSIQVANVHLDQVDPPLVEVAPTVVVSSNGPHADADLQGVLMSLERTACYGTCPIYTVSVSGDGTVTWEGTMNVAVQETRITYISAAAVRQLVAAFQRIHYLTLGDSYTNYMVTDSPSAITTFTQGGQTKTIKHYQGDLSTPSRLILLERQIDYVLNTQQWIGAH